jgi:ribosome-associated protein
MQITRTLSISDNELTFTFIRASGPGGQNVNKVATAAHLRFNVLHSPALPFDVKERVRKLAGTRMTRDGVLVIVARRFHSQEQNRADAERRLKILLQKAALRPTVRRATKPSLSERVKRVESKKMRGEIKKQRQVLDE